MRQIITVVYFTILILHIVGNSTPSLDYLQTYTKPLLMPLLLLQLWQAKRTANEKCWRWIAVGLLFSWGGDVLLMFQQKDIFFILGLVSFLLTHVCYIIYFLRYKPVSYSSDNWFVQNRLLAVLIVGYSVYFLSMLMPHLGPMQAPVGIYTFVITVMLIQSLASKKRINSNSYPWFVSGTALFVASDSILAYNKFMTSFASAGILIMLTYGLAQWLIVQGTRQNPDPLFVPED